jgi:hypothetical protein
VKAWFSDKVKTARDNRLPGISFQYEFSGQGTTLPRMDIAAFVGFAPSGPLHVPVPVEDLDEYHEIFGHDYPLAIDPTSGRTEYAHLHGTVASFFSNGGRRCWVIRVAGNSARSNCFPLSGMLMARCSPDGRVEQVIPAFARARSEGSWSDPLRTNTSLISRPLQVADYTMETDRIAPILDAPQGIGPGDLIRLTITRDHNIPAEKDAYHAIMVVGSVERQPSEESPNPDRFKVMTDGQLWLRKARPDHLPEQPEDATARIYSREYGPGTIPTDNASSQKECIFDLSGFESDPIPVTFLEGDQGQPDGMDETAISIRMDTAPEDAPPPGSLLRIDVGAEQLWIKAGQVSIEKRGDADSDTTTRVSGIGCWLVDAPMIDPAGFVHHWEVLTCEIMVKSGGRQIARLSDLGFGQNHPRFLGALPTDAVRHGQDVPIKQRPTDGPGANLVGAEPMGGPKQDLSPLAGLPVDGFFFPLEMEAEPYSALGPVRLIDEPFERDGLQQFNADLFLDHALKTTVTANIIPASDHIRFLGPSPRPLRGLHAALGIEEAAVVAVPDAVHPPWEMTAWPQPRPAEPSRPPKRPHWWPFLACEPPPEIPAVSEPEKGNFLDCDIRVVPAPRLHTQTASTQGGVVKLFWETDRADAGHLLQVSHLTDFSDAVTMPMGRRTLFEFYGLREGTYYFRVQARAGANVSDWSNGIALQIMPSFRLQLLPADSEEATRLKIIHGALLRMCAARGDLFGVLSLPRHFRGNDCDAYVHCLRQTRPTRDRTAGAFNANEGNALSYGAVYHPWMMRRAVQVPEAGNFIPPDGAVCGVLAHRAITRGAWVAPANQIIHRIYALDPVIRRERRLGLHQSQINLIQQEAAGFVCYSAQTLSKDASLVPINVRRLLILIRKFLKHMAERYVFQPNNEAFRRMVERDLKSVFDSLLGQGAFAGHTPDAAYRIVADESLNSPHSINRGRFIAEVSVAPSVPLKFLTIRLLQTGAGAFQTMEA